MTPDKINRAIAEATGWTVILESCSDKIGNFWGGYSPSDPHNWIPIPNYHNDLNAMHEAEGTLDSVIQIKSYCYHLTSQAKPEYATEHLVRASAADKAEAFLRTLGKWEDNK